MDDSRTITGQICATCWHVYAGEDFTPEEGQQFTDGWDELTEAYPDCVPVLIVEPEEPEFKDGAMCIVCCSTLASDFTPAQFNLIPR